MRGLEDDWHASKERFCAQTADKSEPIHVWHDNIGDHEIRKFGSRQFQGLGTIVSFQHTMSKRTQECNKQLAVSWACIDDQDGCHTFLYLLLGVIQLAENSKSFF